MQPCGVSIRIRSVIDCEDYSSNKESLKQTVIEISVEEALQSSTISP